MRVSHSTRLTTTKNIQLHSSMLRKLSFIYSCILTYQATNAIHVAVMKKDIKNNAPHLKEIDEGKGPIHDV